MPTPRKYSDEMRERAVGMVEQTLKENLGLANQRACRDLGDQQGIPGPTLRNWFRDGVASSRSPRAVVVTDDPASRTAQLEKENRELRRASAILKSASTFFRGYDATPEDSDAERF